MQKIKLTFLFWIYLGLCESVNYIYYEKPTYYIYTELLW